MRITFDKNELVKAIRWTSAIIDGKDAVATIRMEVTPEKVLFSSSASDGARSMEVGATIEDVDTEVTLNLLAEALRKIPAQCISDEVEFKYDSTSTKNKTKVFVHGGVRLSIPIISGRRKYAAVITDTMVDVGSCVPADFIATVKLLSPLSDPVAATPSLHCIDFTFDGKGAIKFMATDSFVVSTREITYEPVSPEEHRFLLLANDVKQLAEASEATEMEVYVDNRSVAFSFNDGRTARINFIDANPIKYEMLILKDRDDVTITVDRNELYQAVSNLNKWNTENGLVLSIDPENGVTVKSEEGDWSIVVPIVETTMQDADDILFARSILLKALRASDGSMVRFRYVPNGENLTGLGVVLDQLNPDGEMDESVYVMCVPATKEQ